MTDLNGKVTIFAEQNFIRFIVMGIICNRPRATSTVKWLYFRGENKARFDCALKDNQ